LSVFPTNGGELKQTSQTVNSLSMTNRFIVLLIPKLQSHFAEFLQLYSSIALVYSTRPPVSDFIRSAEKR